MKIILTMSSTLAALFALFSAYGGFFFMDTTPKVYSYNKPAEIKSVSIQKQSPINKKTSTKPTSKTHMKIRTPSGIFIKRNAVNCLAANIYFEAGSDKEPFLNKLGTGFVVVNRVNHSDFPTTICDVVEQYKVKGIPQFSWVSTKPTQILYQESWELSQKIAKGILRGEYIDPTKGATHYYADYIKTPDWAKNGKLEFTTKLGRHHYLKEKDNDS